MSPGVGERARTEDPCSSAFGWPEIRGSTKLIYLQYVPPSKRERKLSLVLSPSLYSDHMYSHILTRHVNSGKTAEPTCLMNSRTQYATPPKS